MFPTTRPTPCRCMIYGGAPRPQPDPFDELVAADPDLVASLAVLEGLFATVA